MSFVNQLAIKSGRGVNIYGGAGADSGARGTAVPEKN